MKVFVTKYALTRGILEVNASIVHHGSRAYARFKDRGSVRLTREWFGTLAEALQVAERMRQTKIASLRRQLKTLETRTFKQVKA